MSCSDELLFLDILHMYNTCTEEPVVATCALTPFLIRPVTSMRRPAVLTAAGRLASLVSIAMGVR